MAIDTRTEAEKRYDAERDGTLYTAPAAPSVRATIVAMLEAAEEMPSGVPIYALLKEDRVANYIWWRCVDWVLYRLANGMPVLRMNSDDDTPAEINACFVAAQRAYNCANWPTPIDVQDFGNGNVIDRWEKGPPPPPSPALREAVRLIDQIFGDTP